VASAFSQFSYRKHSRVAAQPKANSAAEHQLVVRSNIIEGSVGLVAAVRVSEVDGL
jgi:hypothetical protein